MLSFVVLGTICHVYNVDDVELLICVPNYGGVDVLLLKHRPRGRKQLSEYQLRSCAIRHGWRAVRPLNDARYQQAIQRTTE